MARLGEVWRDVARCGEMWRDVARCGGVWRGVSECFGMSEYEKERKSRKAIYYIVGPRMFNCLYPICGG